VILGDSLHRQREIVVPRTLALARTRDRVEAHVVRPARRIVPGWNDADRLSFEHGKRRAAEIEHDVADIARRAIARQPVVAGDRGDRRLLDRVEVDVRMRRRPGRRRRAALARRRERRDPRDVGRQFGFRVGVDLALRRQAVPRELLFQRVGVLLLDLPPVVDGAGGAGRNALVAARALADVDDVVPGVMRDGVDRAGLFAGVAANADLRIDEVLADDLDRRRAHCAVLAPTRT
jgi:hypothetical protein